LVARCSTAQITQYSWTLVLFGALALAPSLANAQTPPALAGRYVACFRGADTTRPACGTLTLAPTTVCGSLLDGSYSVLFGALAGAGTADARWPRNEAHFTWEQSAAGTVRFSRTAFVADSLLGGETRCDQSDVSNFEGWGRVAGDSIAGSWGRYDRSAGTDTLGTFVLRRMPR
jgi:hypothetical protein